MVLVFNTGLYIFYSQMLCSQTDFIRVVDDCCIIVYCSKLRSLMDILKRCLNAMVTANINSPLEMKEQLKSE